MQNKFQICANHVIISIEISLTFLFNSFLLNIFSILSSLGVYSGRDVTHLQLIVDIKIWESIEIGLPSYVSCA